MGQASSYYDGPYGPFASRHHASTCHVKKIIDSNDFSLFLSELKTVIKQRDSIGFATPAMVESFSRQIAQKNGCMRNSLQKAASASTLDAGSVLDELTHDALSYRVQMCEGRKRPLVLIRCSCSARYGGMDLDGHDSRGQAALHVASRKKDHEMLVLLLNLGADPESVSKWGLTPLLIACENGDLKSMQLLLSAGVDPNAKENLKLKVFCNLARTPLVIAALHGHAHCLSALISAKADVNEADLEGNSPIHKSAVYGHVSCVKLLLDHGCDVNAKNKSGASALQLALMQTNVEIVKLLIQAGCDVSESSLEFPPILTLAAMTGETDVLYMCIKHGHSVDSADKSGRTPLYYTFTGDTHRLEENYPAITSQGISLDFHFAQFTCRRETFRVLVEHGANVEAILKDALSANILTVKHFTLPQNIELFKICLRACGFGVIKDIEVETLFWKLVSRNSAQLLMLLMQALPRLSCLIAPRLSQAVDWTGVHSHDAVVAHLEGVGADYSTSDWIARYVKQTHSLQSWSRQIIRQCISSNVPYFSPRLPLPPRLKEYITLEE